MGEELRPWEYKFNNNSKTWPKNTLEEVWQQFDSVKYPSTPESLGKHVYWEELDMLDHLCRCMMSSIAKRFTVLSDATQECRIWVPSLAS